MYPLVLELEFSESVPIVIDENTQINIWFDDSGSMNQTLSPLETMRNTILKNCLLQFYNNDSNLYDANVSVKNFSEKSSGNERTFWILDTTGTTGSVTKVINLAFQDESSPYGADGASCHSRNGASGAFGGGGGVRRSSKELHNSNISTTVPT